MRPNRYSLGESSLVVTTVAARGAVSRSMAEHKKRERMSPRIVGHHDGTIQALT